METIIELKELSPQDLIGIKGGGPVAWLIAGLIVSEILDRDNYSDFCDGFNAARKVRQE